MKAVPGCSLYFLMGVYSGFLLHLYAVHKTITILNDQKTTL
jgi:hypothetical protein